MTNLKKSFEQEATLRNLSDRTRKSYWWHINDYGRFIGKGPEQTGIEELRGYFQSMLTDGNHKPGSVKMGYYALRFLFTNIYHKEWAKEYLPTPKVAKTLPLVLSQDEVAEVLGAIRNFKHRAIIMLIYSTGARVSECVNIKLTDIDSHRMQVNIQEGKGLKQRKEPLSPVLLSVLRKYYKEYKPGNYQFEGPAEKARTLALPPCGLFVKMPGTVPPGLKSPTPAYFSPLVCHAPLGAWYQPIGHPAAHGALRFEQHAQVPPCGATRYKKSGQPVGQVGRIGELMQNQISLADILNEYGDDYIGRNRVSGQEKGLLHLLPACRTAALGIHYEKCDKCSYTTKSYNSCRNRHCLPSARDQQKDKLEWLDKRMKELLPVGYYHLVFTIPHERNPLCLQNKKTMYGLLFKAASQTLLELARDVKHLGADTGLVTVLHIPLCGTGSGGKT